MSAFRSPVVLVAIALWIANDHVLKALYPGFLTGKLSDACGLVVTPLIVLVIGSWVAPTLARHPFAPAAVAAVVAIAFALVKTWSPANALYDHVFEAVRMPLRLLDAAPRGMTWRPHVSLVMDPTDLLVLPFAILPARLAKVAPCSTERP